MTQKYTAEYFRKLDSNFTDEEIAALMARWNRTEPQTVTEIRQGILNEREAREDLADRWAGKLRKRKEKNKTGK